MKKVEKDLDRVPPSLHSPLTEQRRKELINHGGWIRKSQYQDRYKAKDIKTALTKLYGYKCAYCEQRTESFHIEHFRPKTQYYWLAYSWDNLMLCCPKCNEIKSNCFDVTTRADITSIAINDIHKLTEQYNKWEKNQLIYPEKEDVSDKVVFTKGGKMSSKNTPVDATIKICKLNRESLIEFRKPVYDTLEKGILSRIGNPQELKRRIREFVEETQLPHTEFTLFRKYIIKELLPGLNRDIAPTKEE